MYYNGTNTSKVSSVDSAIEGLGTEEPQIAARIQLNALDVATSQCQLWLEYYSQPSNRKTKQNHEPLDCKFS